MRAACVRREPSGRSAKWSASWRSRWCSWARLPLTWNFDLLRRLSFDFSALTDTFSRNDAPAGARPSDEPGTEVIGDSSIAGGVSLPTSIKTDEPDPAGVEAPEEAPAEAPQAAPAAPGDAPTSREPDPAEPAAPASPETEPVVAAANEAPAVPLRRRSPKCPQDRRRSASASASCMSPRRTPAPACSCYATAAAEAFRSSPGGRRTGPPPQAATSRRLEPRVERFGAGEQNRTLHVPIVGDRNVEGSENFYVHVAVGDSGRAVDPVGQIEVVITDDD